MENCYDVKIEILITQAFKTYADSKTKSFFWLILNHAIPVKDRYFGNTDKTCPLCGEVEDIKHLLHKCSNSKQIVDTINAEINVRGWELYQPNKFAKRWLKKLDKFRESIFILTILQITASYIWAIRNNLLFNNENPSLSEVTANEIWKEFENSIKAKISSIEEKEKWWDNQNALTLINERVWNNKKRDILEEKLALRDALFIKDYTINEINVRDCFADNDNFVEFQQTELKAATTGSRWRLLTVAAPGSKHKEGSLLYSQTLSKD